MKKKASSKQKSASSRQSKSHQRKIDKRGKKEKQVVVEVKQEVKKVPFGAADDLPYLWEVRAPEEKIVTSLSNVNAKEESEECAGAGGEDDDVVLIGASCSDVDNYSHLREHCVKHAFKTYSNISNCNSEAYEGNHVCCDKCFCYVCDCVASKCIFWSIPNSLLKDHRLKSAHCHATINSTNQTINEYWKRKRLLHKNPLLNYFSTEQTEEKMCNIYKKFRDLHDKAWRKYEAGEKCDRDRTLPTLWVHRFTTVASCFGYIINLTNVSIQNDPRWLEKFVMLDALTEVTVKRSCRPPPKEHQGPYSVWFSNEYDYNRHMTVLGSRWILLFALSPPPLVSGLAQAIRERMTQLARQSKEPESFKKGFCVFRDLILIDVDDRRVVRATCQLYKSIIRRKEHHLQPSYLKDAHGVKIAKSVIQKDSIMLPFLSDLMDNGVDVREESLLPAKLLRAHANFYHHFTVFTCKELFSQIADVSHDHVFPVLRNVYYAVHADYLHSNRAKYYRRELIQYIQVMVCVIEEAMEAQKDKKKVMDALFKIPRVEPSWRKNPEVNLSYMFKKKQFNGLALFTLADCLVRLRAKATENDPETGICLTESLCKLFTILNKQNVVLSKWYVEEVTRCLKKFCGIAHPEKTFAIAYKKFVSSFRNWKNREEQEASMYSYLKSNRSIKALCGLDDQKVNLLNKIEACGAQVNNMHHFIFKMVRDKLWNEKVEDERIDRIVEVMKEVVQSRKKRKASEADTCATEKKKKSNK